MKGLRNTKALITGRTSGIGQGIAVSFAAEATRVAINYRGHKDDAAETGALSHHASVHSVYVVAAR
jgi:NAD(P)-dependent dehydrogenase (short-subunit alcohol dehydrogenase family)